ncbi:MAG: acyl--CoA ligase [Rhodocyclales bacterium]|nr:acyl--CoA ligase [Rhodocyclales bacterium]
MTFEADFPPGPELTRAFLIAAARFPGKTALVCGDERVSYAELLPRVAGLARALQDSGLQRGDRVLLMLDNGIEFAVAMHALLLLGAVIVPVSPLTKTDKLRYLLIDTDAVALVAHATLAPAWQAALPRAPALRSVWVVGQADTDDARCRAWPGAAAAALPDLAIDGRELAAIIYTSGTTGQPKGVMLSHDNMRAAWRSVQAYLHLREDDVIGLALPMTFSYGLYHVIMGLGLGATIVIERSVAFPVKLLQRFAAERVTVFPGVPTLFASLLGQDLAAYDLGALRIATNAAAALPIAHLQRLRQAWPQMRFFAMYGLTECKRASYLAPEDIDARPASVGRGMPFQRHWLVDEDGRDVTVGGVGQLVGAGPHVMQGYWRRPGESAEKLRPAPDGTPALYTGDIFRSDADGYLYFVSRSDDIIKSRGEKVSPVEVEHAICGLPGVIDAAVVGVPDELLGEAVQAYVRIATGVQLTERDVIRHCLATLESFMAPKRVVFVEELPVTDSGKVQRSGLRNLHPPTNS